MTMPGFPTPADLIRCLTAITPDITLWTGTGRHSVIARYRSWTASMGPYKIINIPRACKHGIIMDVEEDSKHVLRAATFIARI